MKKGFRKTISLESNQSRLTMEGALTAAAIGLMMMLVLQQQQTQASGGEEVQGNPRPNFDATRVPTGRIAVSQASTQDATRLRQASPFTAQDLGDVRIDDTKHKNGGSATSPRISFGLTDGRAPYGGGYGGSAQGSSGTYGAENSSGRSNGGYRSSSSSQTTQQSTQQSEAPSIGASTGPGRGASGAPITIDTTGLSSGEAANAMAATPSAGAAVGPGKGATGVAGVADQSSIQSGKAGAAVQELASAGALAGPSKGATGLAGSFTGNLNSGGGGAPEVVKPSAATASLEYHAFDGPMAGSTAYIDTNNNGFFDPGDWYTYTDDQGYFNIDYVDSNKNGTWEQTEALKRGDGSTYYLTEGASLQVHVIGGTDTVSNSLNRHEMLTSLSGTGGVVSPITTLVEGISKDLGVANAEAEAMVGKILGIDSTVDLLKYDPFSITVSNSRSLDNNNIALDYKVKAAQIFNLGYVTEAVAGQESFNGLQSLGNELLKAATHSDGSIGSLDLTANDDLKKYFSGLSSSISAGALDAFTSITQQANSLIKQSGASGEVLSVISSDRSIDGLGSNKLLNKGIDSSRDLLADVLKKDESFADRGAAKLFWSDANVADGSIAFEALHNFIGLPSDIHSYASLPDVQLQAEHRGETNAIAAKGNAVVSTYETVSLLKDTTLDYSHYTAKPSSLSNAVAAANKSAAVIAPDATTGIKLSDTPISKAIQTASTTSTTAAAESSTSAAGSTTSSTPSTAASSTVATSTVAASTSASLPSISANNAAQITGATVKTNGSGRVIQLPDASSTANTNQINSASNSSNSNTVSSESTGSSSSSGPPSSSSSNSSSGSSSNSSSGSSSSTSSSSASDANQNSSPNSTTNSSSSSTSTAPSNSAPSNSGSSNSGSSNSGSSSASASNSDSSSGASAGSSTASSNTQTADNNTSKASIEESKSSAVETSKTQEAPADTSKTEVSSNNSSNSNSNSNTSTGSTSSIPAASFTSSTSPSGEAYTAGTASADHTIPVIKESSALATASQANGQHSDVIASVAIEPTTYQSLPNNPLAGSHEQAAIPAASFTSSTSPSGEAYTAGTASADHTIPVIQESSALATASQANSQHSDVIASVAIEPTTYHSLPSDPLAGAHEQAAQISKDLSVQPSSVFNGEPILLEAIHDHSINAQALDGSIEADISQQTRVLDRSTLLMGGQDDVLRVEAITDIHISLFESMGVELHGEISSVAMEFSKIDMGAGDDIIEINSVLSLNIDSSEDIAKLIGDINQEELGMLDSILMGGDGNDTMIVNGAARSRIDGGTGNDDIYLTGESQYVTLDGGAGDDRIFGTNHSETLIGGDGDDLLFGHGGLDEMTGGRGSDIFIVDTDEGVDLGNLNALSDFEKTILSGKISNAELASITDFNGMEGDAIALRSASIGVTQRAEDLFVYTPAASDMDKQVLLLSNFDEFFFSGQVEIKEGYALLTDLDTLVQVTDDGHLHALAHVSSQVTPSNGMVFTTNNSLSS
jgi:hypothetical protein